MSDYETYLSPFSWRYASLDMRRLWSETYKRRFWRSIWVELAEVQSEFGLLRLEQVADLRAHAEQVDISRALEIEAEIQHDLMAELKAFAEQCPLGGGGRGASYAELIGVQNLAEFETRLSTRLGLPFFPVTTQTYPRKQDYRVISALAGLGATLHKFAFDLRLLQSPPIGELAEPFGRRQVGSSAMPFKRNPINAGKISSLARPLDPMPP